MSDWTDDRFDHVIQLREKALNAARQLWADYLLVNSTLTYHKEKNKFLVKFLYVTVLFPSSFPGRQVVSLKGTIQ